MGHKIYLSIILLLLGVLMLTLGQKKEVSIDSMITKNKQVIKISAISLAERIIENKLDYTLIDIRKEKAHAGIEIQGSLSMPIESIASKYKNLEKGKFILIIGNKEENMKKVSIFLSNKGYDSFIIDGGINAWKNKILNPIIPKDTDSEVTFSKYKYIRAISNYLQGKGDLKMPLIKRKRVILKRVKSASADGGC